MLCLRARAVPQLAAPHHAADPLHTATTLLPPPFSALVAAPHTARSRKVLTGCRSRWKLSTGRRFSGADTRYVESIPGPGQYTLPSGVGKQWVSNKLTTPAAAFGKDGIRLRPKVGRPVMGRVGCVRHVVCK